MISYGCLYNIALESILYTYVHMCMQDSNRKAGKAVSIPTDMQQHMLLLQHNDMNAVLLDI